MNHVELILFGAGTLSLTCFAISTFYPYVASRLEVIAGRRSEQLKGDFLFMSCGTLLRAFIMLGLASSIIAYWMTGVALASVSVIAFPVVMSGIAVRRYQRMRKHRVIH